MHKHKPSNRKPERDRTLYSGFPIHTLMYSVTELSIYMNKVIRIEFQYEADSQTDPHRTIGQHVLAVLIPLILVNAHPQFYSHFQLRQTEFFSSLPQHSRRSRVSIVHRKQLRLLHQLLTDQLLADAMAYVQVRGITFQQLAETSIETLIREHGSLLSYKPEAPAAPTDGPEEKEES